MVALRQSKLSMIGVLSILFVAWMAASNHCALAAMPTWGQASAHQCCHKDSSAPAHHQEPNQCCQALGATMPLVVNAPAVDGGHFSFAWDIAWVSVASSFDADPVLVLLPKATGPPGGNLLTDILLKRSVPAHAPPVV